MATYALVAINEWGSSDIYFGDFAKLPTLKQATAQLKLRKLKSKVVAIVETKSGAEVRYESMAWNLTPIQGE